MKETHRPIFSIHSTGEQVLKLTIRIIAYTHGAMIALAGRNEGLALDNQPSNFVFNSRAIF